MIQRDRLSVTGADLGTIPDDVTALQADVAANTSDIADNTSEISGLDVRVDALDGVSNVGDVGATISLTPGSGNGTVKIITLTSATCNITFNNGSANGLRKQLELVLIQDATGSRAYTFVSNVLWPGGVDPTPSTAANAIDRYLFVSHDNGATWYGNQVGAGYA